MEPVTTWSEVGDRIRELRLAHQLSQADLAGRVGIARTALVRVESGERQVSALELGRLADALDVSLAHFVTRPPRSVRSYRSPLAEDLDRSERDRLLLDIDLEGHARDADWLAERGVLPPTPTLSGSPVADAADAVTLAGRARQVAAEGGGPLGGLCDVAEAFGLYLLVVDRDASGASLQLQPGLGVAVIGGQAPPGHRRWTAAHELGHHLIGDAYHSDVGVAASEQEKESIIDAFVSEFLLPRHELQSRWSHSSRTDHHARLVELAAAYRLSWTAVVAAAAAAQVIDGSAAHHLRSRTPTRGDFLEVTGAEPVPDLEIGATGREWKQATLTAWRRGDITTARAAELLHGALLPSDFPPRHASAEA